MNEMQILRNALFDEISKIKKGNADLDESQAIVKVSNAIISTYNTEIKAVNTLIDSRDKAIETPSISIFNDTDKNVLDYKYD